MANHDSADFNAAREQLAQAIRDYDAFIRPEARVVTGSTVVYEATLFDERGDEMYNVQHVILDGTLAQTAGLLDVARDRVVKHINSPRSHGYTEDDEE